MIASSKVSWDAGSESLENVTVTSLGWVISGSPPYTIRAGARWGAVENPASWIGCPASWAGAPESTERPASGTALPPPQPAQRSTAPAQRKRRMRFHHSVGPFETGRFLPSNDSGTPTGEAV